MSPLKEDTTAAIPPPIDVAPPIRLPIPEESRPLIEMDLAPLARTSFTVSSVAPANAFENIPEIPSEIMELPSDFVFNR